jgi:hypothetical protein
MWNTVIPWIRYFIIIIIIIMILQGTGHSRPVPIQNLNSELYESILTLVGLLGWGISLTQSLYLHRTTQYRKMRTRIHTTSGIQTHDPSVRAAEDSTCLRPLGHWDRLDKVLATIKFRIFCLPLPSVKNFKTNIKSIYLLVIFHGYATWSLTLLEKILRMFETRRITTLWCSANVVRVVRLGRIGMMGHIATKLKIRNAYTIFIARPWYIWEHNIKMCVRDIGCEGEDGLNWLSKGANDCPFSEHGNELLGSLQTEFFDRLIEDHL